MRNIAMVLMLMLMSIGTGIGTNVDTDELEEISEYVMMSGGAGIYQPNVDITSSKVHVEYTSVSSDILSVAQDMGTIIGVYWSILDYTNTGDLSVDVYGMGGGWVASYKCKRSWLDGKDSENENDMKEISLKVMESIKV